MDETGFCLIVVFLTNVIWALKYINDHVEFSFFLIFSSIIVTGGLFSDSLRTILIFVELFLWLFFLVFRAE